MDILLIALVFLGLFVFTIVGTKALTALFRLVDKAHPLAWLPLAGLLMTAPFTIGL